VVRLQHPIAGDRSEEVSIGVVFGVGDTYMHCTHKATKKTMKAANTSAKVPQTSFRKSDFSGAIRKYETRIDIFTVLEARTNNVWPARDAC
jgi:hypothetical protein